LVDLTTATLAIAATNVAVAVATISLAGVAYKQMRESRRQARHQLAILSDQTAILRSQQDPLLKAHAFSLKGNELSVKLVNRGKGRARRIGVETWFFPTVFQPTDDQGKPVRFTDQMLEDYKKKGQNVSGRFLEKPEAPLKFQKWQNGKASSYVSFLASKLTGDSLLDPAEDHEFGLRQEEPVFKIELDETHFQHLKFSELKNLIRDSGFKFVSIWFRIACKDSVDRPVYGESFKFIAFVDQHKTLEEAMASQHKPSFFAVDAQQMDREMGGIDGELYKLERSTENLPIEQRELLERDDRSRSRLLHPRKKGLWARIRRKS
jgi:hypothetical protein